MITNLKNFIFYFFLSLLRKISFYKNSKCKIKFLLGYLFEIIIVT